MLPNDFLTGLQSYIDQHYIAPEPAAAGAEPNTLDALSDSITEKYYRRRTPDSSACYDSVPSFSDLRFGLSSSDDGFSYSIGSVPASVTPASSAPEQDKTPASEKLPGSLKGLDQFVSEHQNPSFSAELMRLIDESGHKDSVIYTRAGIDRRHFSKIRSNPDYHPGKQTAVAFCLALHLSKQSSEDLLRCAGYSFSHSEISDLVISYCIENGIYDIIDVNTALAYFSLKPIGTAE